ncbi:Peptidyl-tRNA hydrolase mitochondrial [Micractinium conductrix]|uniref:peptidyl-tRNA hydrolase n=1 Tax=Micractinium conductrix TaxID=554055 RepID=A0A2P6VEG4_9CHLO|nr:Peptidyl-tRNA hydrolase mitochondrial [Micractinium conductrix]|eukprot:PSC72483.1 Peptidyl-tRNA hydrolase mitochondrial [Micractinium conductrix]
MLKNAATLVLGVVIGWITSRFAPAREHDEGSDWETDDEDGAGSGGAPAARRRRRPSHAAAHPTEELKMVLVVNDELKMGKGKIGAQCAHAAVGAVERLHEQRWGTVLHHWEACGQPKICLRASTTAELRQLAGAASGKGLPTYVVQDAGRTQVAPGSRTVLAIGPAPKSAIDGVTGHLKLL